MKNLETFDNLDLKRETCRVTPRDLVQSPGWKVMPWIERCEVGKKGISLG